MRVVGENCGFYLASRARAESKGVKEEVSKPSKTDSLNQNDAKTRELVTQVVEKHLQAPPSAQVSLLCTENFEHIQAALTDKSVNSTQSNRQSSKLSPLLLQKYVGLIPSDRGWTIPLVLFCLYSATDLLELGVARDSMLAASIFQKCFRKDVLNPFKNGSGPFSADAICANIDNIGVQFAGELTPSSVLRSLMRKFGAKEVVLDETSFLGDRACDIAFNMKAVQIDDNLTILPFSTHPKKTRRPKYLLSVATYMKEICGESGPRTKYLCFTKSMSQAVTLPNLEFCIHGQKYKLKAIVMFQENKLYETYIFDGKDTFSFGYVPGNSKSSNTIEKVVGMRDTMTSALRDFGACDRNPLLLPEEEVEGDSDAAGVRNRYKQYTNVIRHSQLYVYEKVEV